MERNEQQLRCSNGILNPAALTNDSKIDYCEMYRSKNTCLCMTVKDKQNEFDTSPKCNGMCTKQNINIYIENYEARTNQEKCDPTNLDTYSYYKSVKSQGKMSAINNLYIARNQSIYTDLVWDETLNETDTSRNSESAKNRSNVTYYPYLTSRRPYMKEGTSCIKDKIENISSCNHVQLNIAPGAENSLYSEINKYICRDDTDKDRKVLKDGQDHGSTLFVSGSVPASAGNNLYVAPPYFTVDKFVNQNQTGIVPRKQSSQFCSRNLYNNQSMPSNGCEYQAPENHLIQTGENILINSNDHLIGIQFVESSNIPLMRLKTSIEPFGLEMRQQHRRLPIKKDICNYEKNCISSKIENYQRGTNINANFSCVSDSNRPTDFIQNKNNPISFPLEQCNGADSTELDNSNIYGITDFSTTCNTSGNSQRNIPCHDFRNMQYKSDAMHESYAKKPYSNLIMPPAKNVIRETRKPNYRELINHVHALRSATSEDDLNMQIIKRTLNYNQQSKVGPHSILSRKLSTKPPSNNIFEDSYESNCLKSREPQPLFRTKANTATPLDLSVKTIKNKADSTENNVNCKVLVTQNGYPPKYNFRPDFSENRSLISNADSKIRETNGTVTNLVQKNFKSEVNMNVRTHFAEYCNRTDNDLSVNKSMVGCRLENEIMLQTSIPKINGNIICSLQNCPQIVRDTGDSKQTTGIKVEVTLKRTIPFDNDDDNELMHKKICLERFYHSNFNASTFKYPERSQLDLKKGSSDYTYNLSIEEPLTTENERNAQTNMIISKTEMVAKNEPTINKLRTNLNNNNQGALSSFSARIRTKGELKGFTFQEDKEVTNQMPFWNKENCQCPYGTQSPSERDEVDLREWGNTCNSFVDQLLRNYKNSHAEIKESISCENKLSLQPLQTNQSTDPKKDILPDIHKLNNSEQRHLFEESCNQIMEYKNICFNTTRDPLSLSNITGPTSVFKGNAGDNILKHKTDLRSNEINNGKSASIEGEYTVNPNNNESNMCPEKIQPNQKDICIKMFDGVQNYINNNSCKKYTAGNKNKEQNKLNNISRAIDRTKVSVVRLKREKYSSKRYTPCDNVNFKLKDCEINQVQTSKTEENAILNKNVNKKGQSLPCISNSTLGRTNLSFECIRRRQGNVDTALGNTESKLSTITTRLRHRRLQIKKKNEIGESNNTNKCKKSKIILNRYQNLSERELSNDPDALYLEVYRYKRALKIPPNLITIRNPHTQRISASLPDLDLNLEDALENKTMKVNSDCKVTDVPKSIIDVLHSRVVKSKCQVKSTQKHSKKEHQQVSKVTMQRCHNSDLNFEPLKCDSSNCSYREHRNVFETQVLTSRTRMEYKMQLNKEVIREIFGSSERPASAPPEISNVKSSYEIALEKNYNKCFKLLNFSIENDVESPIDCKQHKEIKTHVKRNLDDSHYVINSSTKDNDQSIVSSKCKRKRSGRPYRRKFRSGFDYLRKRKKSNNHPLYNYPHLKTRMENYITDANLQFKSENDVLKEIQKWVLNKGVGQSALHKAARLGYIDVIVYCLEKMGLNPDHKDNAGYTPLHDACVNGSLEIARILLQYGANHSEGAHSGIRPLHEASENGHIEIVRMLLSYGADPLLETYSGQTPLMLASDSEMNNFISMHLLDVQGKALSNCAWKFAGPWNIFDGAENGYDAFNDVLSLDTSKNKNYVCAENKSNYVSNTNGSQLPSSKNRTLKNDVCEFEIFVDHVDAERQLFEFEESNMPLPPLYLLKDEGMEKWVLLTDLCSLLKVKSRDTLLHKIFPCISSSTVNRAFIRELKMCEFLEKATCLQLLCAGEKINICHSKVVLIKYNENVRKLLGVKTIFMKF